jgi:hypothetical protein
MATSQQPARLGRPDRRPAGRGLRGVAAARRGLQATALAAAIAAGVLALAACGTIVAPTAHTSGSGAGQSGGSASGAPSGTAPIAAGQLLCARPASTSRVAIAQSLLPRIIQPVRPGQQAAPPQPPASSKPPKSPKSDMPAGAHSPAPVATPRPGLFVVKTVTSAVQVHALARAVCGLPRFPRGAIRCPAAFLGSYELTFTSGGRKLPVVVQDSGCQAVTGAGGVRSAVGKPAFWKLLTKLAGPPVRFPGHLPGEPGGPVLPGQHCMRPMAGQAPVKPARACPQSAMPIVPRQQ